MSRKTLVAKLPRNQSRSATESAEQMRTDSWTDRGADGGNGQYYCFG